MSLEQSINSLTEAVNNLAKLFQAGGIVPKTTSEPKVDGSPKGAAPAEPPPAKAKKTTTAREPDQVLGKNEKTDEELKEEAFGEGGTCRTPFLELGKKGRRDVQLIVCAKHGVARISEVPVSKIGGLKVDIEALLSAVTQGKEGPITAALNSLPDDMAAAIRAGDMEAFKKALK